MSTILITGANGQLGYEIRLQSVNKTSHKFIFTDIEDLDITDAIAVSRFVTDKSIDFIVNCAAYTAVDKAEDDLELCHRINAFAVKNLAQAARQIGAKMIHISTDYVYSGTNYKPYLEEDLTGPRSVYGKTKLEGEKLLFETCEDSLVLRTSWLYSPYGNNFVKTMMRLGAERNELSVVADQIGSPTYAADLAGVILSIIDSRKFVPGIYNYSNEGICSWYDFAKTIHRMSGIDTCNVVPIAGADYKAKAERPFYSVMNKKKIKNIYGVEIPWWEDSLLKCIRILMK
ncbi:dTDP-4-dehydrorhamnose reductase [Coprobacter tertius]|uniref:dTDP-4-dehydrorhamnose reductase n=1 Tax=Coprobacter tertius TaxID=2944915 RepID=A0ABT1MH18_9BACT|nr:dTDP-4-dehydrorhamnose reductase [Coprobacter tertius]MCP9611915.1 dTDP-4-dehydrorhamnose reductase [Coprobacter tertius]